MPHSQNSLRDYGKKDNMPAIKKVKQKSAYRIWSEIAMAKEFELYCE